jgi:hypothetical protein
MYLRICIRIVYVFMCLCIYVFMYLCVYVFYVFMYYVFMYLQLVRVTLLLTAKKINRLSQHM